MKDISKTEYQKRPKLSEKQMAQVTDLLAKNGIAINNNNSLDQDRSIVLFPDGHFFDFSTKKEVRWFADMNHLLEKRPDIIGAPVQAKTYRANPATSKTKNPDFLLRKHKGYSGEMEEFYELEDSRRCLVTMLTE